ncbi:MAG: F0F1 ATP synthase subunit delta [Patescibacteria group bacterium]|nr:F0F1 ATP synthase subunit delta [Patescibacteria group bacterium]
MDEAVIFSTYKLSNDEVNEIVKKIPILKKFKIVNKINKSLIAGLLIKFADKIIDLSFKNRLKIISQNLYEQI